MQSEIILSEKRRVYEAFLIACPMPNDAYEIVTDEIQDARNRRIKDAYAVTMLNAAPDVTFAITRYLTEFDEACQILSPESEPLHPVFKSLGKSHNDIILEMRRDGLAWSVFSHRAKTRLPKNRLEHAKKNALD